MMNTVGASFIAWAPGNQENHIPQAYRRFYRNMKDIGYTAPVAVHDTGHVIGKCHYIPVGHSPLIDKGLMAILWLCSNRYQHGVGDHREKGMPE